MIRRLIILLLIVGCVFAREEKMSDLEKQMEYENTGATFSNGWGGSVSYGFLSEKITFSFFDFSYLYNFNEYSEFYGTFSYLIFGGGIGLGYKYYTENKSKSSMFISTCAHYSLMGDGYETFYGISIAPGYSILKERKTIVNKQRFRGELKSNKYKKTALNVGVSFMYMGDNSIGVLPFISLENRL